jgi:hypothetical protein
LLGIAGKSAFVVPQPQPAEVGGDEKLQSRLHHNAHVVRNHEVNRRFFEDLLGIPLVATCCEKTFSSELNRRSTSATPSSAWGAITTSPSRPSPGPMTS